MMKLGARLQELLAGDKLSVEEKRIWNLPGRITQTKKFPVRICTYTGRSGEQKFPQLDGSPQGK